jgi:hypothetical protein
MWLRSKTGMPGRIECIEAEDWCPPPMDVTVGKGTKIISVTRGRKFGSIAYLGCLNGQAAISGDTAVVCTKDRIWVPRYELNIANGINGGFGDGNGGTGNGGNGNGGDGGNGGNNATANATNGDAMGNGANGGNGNGANGNGANGANVNGANGANGAAGGNGNTGGLAANATDSAEEVEESLVFLDPSHPDYPREGVLTCSSMLTPSQQIKYFTNRNDKIQHSETFQHFNSTVSIRCQPGYKLVRGGINEIPPPEPLNTTTTPAPSVGLDDGAIDDGNATNVTNMTTSTTTAAASAPAGAPGKNSSSMLYSVKFLLYSHRVMLVKEIGCFCGRYLGRNLFVFHL